MLGHACSYLFFETWLSIPTNHRLLPPPPQPFFASCSQTHRFWGFYIFTIIKIDAHPIITLKMSLTILPNERNLSSSFTTFAHVASHASPTRWRPVSMDT